MFRGFQLKALQGLWCKVCLGVHPEHCTCKPQSPKEIGDPNMDSKQYDPHSKDTLNKCDKKECGAWTHEPKP